MSASIKAGLSETIVASSAERASAIRSRPSVRALHLATVTLPLDKRETEKLAAHAVDHIVHGFRHQLRDDFVGAKPSFWGATEGVSWRLCFSPSSEGSGVRRPRLGRYR
jgi:hypothetical protein